MCTAIRITGFAGRNLDIENGYGERLIITPRNYPIELKCEEEIRSHYAFFGIGIEKNGYPLYFDAANEKGLFVAGLNYVGNATYFDKRDYSVNLAPYEIIPYLLANCSSVGEAKFVLSKINLVNIPFCKELPLAQLHFFVADKERSIVIEPDSTRLSIYDNPVDVLTNNPPFPIQLFGLNDYASLSNAPLQMRFCCLPIFDEYSGGLSAFGLPGDLSSKSRFIRACFHRLNINQTPSPSQMMHLLGSVEMPRGSLITKQGYEHTEYTSCVDLNSLIYYYRTYESLSSCGIKLLCENLDTSELKSYPLITIKEPQYQNGSVKY